jgi:transcriptional regulator with XRE-family HTH domain
VPSQATSASGSSPAGSYESEGIRNPSVTVLQKICDAVGITLPEFFGGMESVDDNATKAAEKSRGFDTSNLEQRAIALKPELRHMLHLYLEYLEYLNRKEESDI